MSEPDVVLVWTTIFLGCVAVVAPSLSEVVRRRFFGPKLSLEFDLSPPSCHKTRLLYTSSNGQQVIDPVFVYRMSVRNRGRSQARKCECVLEGVDVANDSGLIEPYGWTTPVSLPWGSGYADFVDINPTRVFFCDLLTVPAERFQKISARSGFWLKSQNPSSSPLSIILNLKAAFFSQPNRLTAGEYRLHVALFAENAAEVRITLHVNWSGRWKEAEGEFFRECIVSRENAS